MTTQDQEFTTSPEATPPAARSAQPPPAKRRPFSMRGFTSLLLTLSFTVMVVAGIMLFLTPRGRVANWTDWTLLGLGKEQWGAVHIMNSILFVIIAGLHLYLNWKMFLGYLKKKAVAGLHMKRELAVATAVAVLFVVGAIASIPPFSSIMALNDEIKDYWEVRAARAPVPHADELTLVEFAGHINLSLAELTQALQKEGFTVDNSELTVGEVGLQKGVAPNDVLTAIQKHYPEAGASHGGRGFGGGRGQGFGRGMGAAGCGEDDSSNDQEGSTAKSHGLHTDTIEDGLGLRMRLGGGGGFGPGQGRGQGQGMGMGRGRGAGFGAGPGSVERSSNAGSGLDQASDRASNEGNTELKGRTIVEKGKPITVEGELKQNGDEWQLVSESGTHNIHLGPEEYRESRGIEIEEGMKAVVTGFSIEEDIAVCSMKISGKTYVFRNEDGRPAWTGGSQGRGRNRTVR